MSLALASRKAALLTPWLRNPLWRSARAVPSLDLRFADNKSLADAVTGQNLITFTRASSGTFVDSQGVLQTASTNVPRFNHNPTTGESLGLLVEESRTNSIRNNTMVGAVAGTPGTVPTNWSDLPTSNGLSRQIVGVGTQAGISYIDIRYSGTASATASTVIQPELSSVTVAATGQSWTASSWLALAAGSTSGLTIIQRVTGRSSVGGFLENTDTTVALSSTLTRYSASITMANASTARVSSDIALSYTSGSAIDITLRIGLPQLEQGAFATSVIPTTTAAATRSADVASITGTNFSSWYRQDEGTVFASSTVMSTSYANGVLWDVGAGGAFGTTAYGAWSGTQWTLNPNTAPVNMFCTVTASAQSASAYALKTNDSSIAAAGLIGTQDTSCAMPASATTLSIGKAGWTAGNYFNGTIRRLTYWPQRLANSTLQAITQ